MIKKLSHNKNTWIFASKPTEGELSDLARTYKIHPLVLEELGRPTFRPKAEKIGPLLYVVLHFPVFRPEVETSAGVEIDFVLGKNFLITATHTHHAALGEFFDTIERDTARAEKLFASHAGMVFHALLNHLYAFALRELDHIKIKIDRVDAALAGDYTPEIVKEIFTIRRDIINFRRSVKPHATAINSLRAHGTELFGEPMVPYLEDIAGEYYKTWNMLENHAETVQALYDAQVSYLSMRSAEITKKLTLVALITFPLTLTATVFSMKVAPDRIFGAPYDFLLIVGIIIAAVFAMRAAFKKRKWF